MWLTSTRASRSGERRGPEPLLRPTEIGHPRVRVQRDDPMDLLGQLIEIMFEGDHGLPERIADLGTGSNELPGDPRSRHRPQGGTHGDCSGRDRLAKPFAVYSTVRCP